MNVNATAKKPFAPDPRLEAVPQRLLIKGVTLRDDGAEGVTIEIPMIEVHVDYPAIEAILLEAGVPKDAAVSYVEAFGHKVYIGEMSRQLAERIERVG